MLSRDIASCISWTAAESAGRACLISTVVPSARSAYTGPASCAILIVVSPSAHRTRDDRVDVGVAEEIADRDHAPDMPGLADHGPAERGGLRGSLQGHHAVLDSHGELARVDAELVPQDDV